MVPSDPSQHTLQANGVLLMCVSTGVCTPVVLEHGGQCRVSMSDFSSLGQLCVKHEVVGSSCKLSILDSWGRVLHRIAGAAAGCWVDRNCFSPDGSSVMLRYSTNMWIWELTSGQLVHNCCEGLLGGGGFNLWAWESSRVWVHTDWPGPQTGLVHRRRQTCGFRLCWVPVPAAGLCVASEWFAVCTAGLLALLDLLPTHSNWLAQAYKDAPEALLQQGQRHTYLSSHAHTASDIHPACAWSEHTGQERPCGALASTRGLLQQM